MGTGSSLGLALDWQAPLRAPTCWQLLTTIARGGFADLQTGQQIPKKKKGGGIGISPTRAGAGPVSSPPTEAK